MLDIKTVIAEFATDAEWNRVRNVMRRGENNTASETYRPAFENCQTSGD